MTLPTLHQNIILLKLIPRLGNRGIVKLISESHNLETENISDSYILSLLKSYQTSPEAIRRRFERIARSIESNALNLVCVSESDYPEALKRSFAPPPLLFYKGNIKYDYSKSIAVVGTRSFSSYGKDACGSFVSELSVNGFTVISGLASGIDAIAHRTAIEKHATCIGVIGHGFNYCFPASNKSLYQSVLDNNGAIISEFLPDIRPTKSTFPIRNKTIASLARATIVIEAAEKSGSLITAKSAFAENREVYAVPADITRHSYQGCNLLIRSNIAKLVSRPSDLLADLGVGSSDSIRLPVESFNFSDLQKSFVDLVSLERITSDEISDKLEIHITVISEILTELELLGVITQDDQQRWRIAN